MTNVDRHFVRTHLSIAGITILGVTVSGANHSLRGLFACLVIGTIAMTLNLIRCIRLRNKEDRRE